MSVVAKTDWGWIGVTATERGIARVVLPCRRRADALSEITPARSPSPPGRGEGEGVAVGLEKRAISLLADYFRTGRMDWNLPLDLGGATDFEKMVWQAARGIPPGSVVTYGELARRIGKPGAARAVGRALGRNPVPVAVPCHRIVGANGRLTGFSAPGGVDLKARLIFHERVYWRE
ncbi:MAG: methylated-DNA--[protein]-cysteine S-methyltransferase [Nitrospirae bacterium]|nr:methylated-DNA--[protein]-cysteine S-methyltransferase [Nitrospirota bacterium]